MNELMFIKNQWNKYYVLVEWEIVNKLTAIHKIFAHTYFSAEQMDMDKINLMLKGFGTLITVI